MVTTNVKRLQSLLFLLIFASCAFGADTALDVEASASGIEPSPAYPGEKVRVLLDATASEPDLEHEEDYVVSERWYWDAMDVSIKDGDNWVDPPEGSVSQDSIEQDEEDEAPATLWAVFHVPGTWKITLRATVIYTDNNNVQHTDTDETDILIEVKPYDVDIISVPECLFLSARYATPVKFRIVGREGRMYQITSIVAELFDGDISLASASTEQRFAAGDGASQSNGSTDTYTVFVAASTYDDVSIDNDKTNSGRFRVRSVVKPVNSSGLPDVIHAKSYTTGVSELDDTQGKIAGVFDHSFNAVDLGAANAANVVLLSISPLIEQDGAKGPDPSIPTYEHWQAGTSGHTAVPHEHPAGMYAFLNVDGSTQEILNEATRIALSTRLFSSPDIAAALEHGEGVKNRIYGKRKGGVWYISYGGRDLANGILGASERAMDLQKTSGNFDLTMFQSGQYKITNSATTGGPINTSGALAGAFTIASALTASNPLASAVLATAAGAFQIISSVDFKTNIDNAAEGSVYIVLHRTRSGGATTVDNSFFPAASLTTVGATNWTGWSPTKPSLACNIADQWVAFVELESASSIITTGIWPWSLNDHEAANLTEYKVTAASEMLQFTVAASE